MKDGIIFVAGIYGVGKSTLSERLGLSIGIPCYSAGDLISALNGETYGRNKIVVNKEKNQDIQRCDALHHRRRNLPHF